MQPEVVYSAHAVQLKGGTVAIAQQQELVET